jgi:hypothetical protein
LAFWAYVKEAFSPRKENKNKNDFCWLALNFYHKLQHSSVKGM